MSKKIRVMIVEDDAMTLKLHKEMLEKETDIEVVGHADKKEEAIDLATELNPDVLLLDINLTNKEDQYGIDIAIQLSISMPNIKIIMLSALLNEDTVRSTIGLGVACNYIIKSNHEKIPQVVRDAYNEIHTIEGTVIDFILKDYQESLKATMNKLTSQHLKILELFYRGYCVEQVADILTLEVQSVRNHQQTIAKRCLGWKWRFKKLTTVELAKRAKVMGLF
ncbi:DNA-binding response regulator [Bacillus sp. M6-12]|uniref:response regulator transcription factor n=1 Tax=Bacillus sp. M6-12 TaxID=2054166 RepID=UPI000C769864|nr:response regulator transcription factor [Bacillus sp. M6-12]PLS19178.1 DNA-binding response regulator [Bacillus sp. M6-12]